jgi:predicted DNA-binding protein (MmcQ/YjbR family)
VGRARRQGGKKIFVFLGRDEEQREKLSPAKQEHMGPPGSYGVSVKLPESGAKVLKRTFASPTEYGLGAKGWVSLIFQAGEKAPIEELEGWIEESYRTIAPKKLAKQLDETRARRK